MARKVGSKLKKIFTISCILFILIALGSCVIATDFYAGKRPYDYGKATWTCEAPEAWFVVNDPEEDENCIYPKGEITVGSETVKFTLSFGYSTVASFTNEKDEVILLGTCEFSPEKLIITVDKKTDTLFNGQYDTITFVRNS